MTKLSGWLRHWNSFISSSRNKDNLPRFQALITGNDVAIVAQKDSGLIFLFFSDLEISSNANTNTDSSVTLNFGRSVESPDENGYFIWHLKQFPFQQEVKFSLCQKWKYIPESTLNGYCWFNDRVALNYQFSSPVNLQKKIYVLFPEAELSMILFSPCKHTNNVSE